MPEVWPFMPRREIAELLRWNTSIERSASAEKREGLSQMIGGYTYTHVLTGSEIALMENLLSAGAINQDFDFPIWAEATKVGDIASGLTSLAVDTNADYRGRAILWEGCLSTQHEVVDLTSARGCQLDLSVATSSAYANASVMPLRAGFIRSINDTRQPDKRFTTFTIDFELRFE